MILTVTLNGSSINPWHKLGLTRNPFPQITKAEWSGANDVLARLDSDPIKNILDLRTRLVGCSAEFIEGCVERYVPGQRTRFTISFPTTEGAV